LREPEPPPVDLRNARVWQRLTLLHAQALPKAPDITTTQVLRDRAGIAVLLGCARVRKTTG